MIVSYASRNLKSCSCKAEVLFPEEVSSLGFLPAVWGCNPSLLRKLFGVFVVDCEAGDADD